MKFKIKVTISFAVIIGLAASLGGFLLYQIENIKEPLTNAIPQKH